MNCGRNHNPYSEKNSELFTNANEDALPTFGGICKWFGFANGKIHQQISKITLVLDSFRSH